MLKLIPNMEFIEMSGADVCCGGAGAFQFEHPDLAEGIAKNKIQAINETSANMVATGCPGCRLQIQGNLGDESIQVVHPIELLELGMSGNQKKPHQALLTSVHPKTPDGKQAVSDLERRHFSSWRVQFGAPPFQDCPAPHRKVLGNRGVARRRTWVRRTRNPKD